MTAAMRPGGAAKRAASARRIERHGRGIDIDEQRPRAGQLDRRDRRDRGVRDRGDIILGAEIERPQRQHQRIGAAGDADAMAAADIGGEVALERLDLGAEDIAAAASTRGDRRVDRGRAARDSRRADRPAGSARIAQT